MNKFKAYSEESLPHFSLVNNLGFFCLVHLPVLIVSNMQSELYLHSLKESLHSFPLFSFEKYIRYCLPSRDGFVSF